MTSQNIETVIKFWKKRLFYISYYLFKYFLRSFLSLFSFWDSYNMNLVYLMLSQRSLRLSSFFSFLSFFYILFCGSNINHSVLQVIYLFFCSVILQLIPSTILSISVCLFLSSCRSLVNISCFLSIIFPRS